MSLGSVFDRFRRQHQLACHCRKALRLGPMGRALRLEPLEDRRLLSLTPGGDESGVNSVVFDGSRYGTIEMSVACTEYSFESVEGTVERLTAEALESAGAGGAPELPQRLLRVALPPATDLESVRLSVLESREVGVAGEHDLAPAPLAYTYAPVESGEAEPGLADPFAEADLVSADAVVDVSAELVLADPDQNVVDGRDVDVYGTDAFVGEEYCTLVDVQQMGRWKIAEVAYSPFSYNPVTDEVRVVESGTIELTFDMGSPLPSALADETRWDDDAAEMVENFEEAVGWYNPAAMGPMLVGANEELSSLAMLGAHHAERDGYSANFVIVTTSDIVSGSGMLDDYVAMREQLGWSVYVATEADWGGGTGDAVAENIRAWLQANYVTMGIEYVMLVGNPDPGIGDVPMKMTYPQGPTGGRYGEDDFGPTDYYFADLTSDWNADGDAYSGEWGSDISTKPIHEVLVGRIPVYNADHATLDSILNKTMVYGSEDDTAWRKSLMMPMAVSNYSFRRTDGVGIANELAAVAHDHGVSTFTLFEKEGTSPTPEPGDLPLTRDNLISRWTSTPTGMITWMGHGSPVSSVRLVMQEDGSTSSISFFRNRDSASLDNLHPSVVFGVSCLNAYPEFSDNLAFSLL